MDNSRTINRSETRLYVWMASGAIVIGVIVLLTIVIVQAILGPTRWDGVMLQTVISCALIGAWAVSSLILWLTWHKKSYEVTQDAIIVHSADNWKTNTTQIYRYESIISIRLVQDFWGKRYGYGNVYMTIPKIDKEVVLRDIKDPVRQLSDIQKYMNSRTDTSLVT